MSVLDEKGSPTPVERVPVRPPLSRLTPLAEEERGAVVKSSVLFGHYEKAVDRESAYEKLKARAAEATAAEPAGQGRKGRSPEPQSDAEKIFGAMAKSAAHAIGSQIGRQIIRGVLGSILGGSSSKRR